MKGRGKMIGTNGLKSKAWRCKICKFNNDSELEACGMCREPKKVMKEP